MGTPSRTMIMARTMSSLHHRLNLIARHHGQYIFVYHSYTQGVVISDWFCVIHMDWIGHKVPYQLFHNKFTVWILPVNGSDRIDRQMYEDSLRTFVCTWASAVYMAEVTHAKKHAHGKYPQYNAPGTNTMHHCNFLHDSKFHWAVLWSTVLLDVLFQSNCNCPTRHCIVNRMPKHVHCISVAVIYPVTQLHFISIHLRDYQSVYSYYTRQIVCFILHTCIIEIPLYMIWCLAM